MTEYRIATPRLLEKKNVQKRERLLWSAATAKSGKLTPNSGERSEAPVTRDTYLCNVFVIISSC